jgi:hypothetical protein
VLYVLYSVEHGRRCIYRARSPTIRLPVAVPPGRSHRRVLRI